MTRDISELSNTKLGNYMLGNQLGKTGMSAVYSAKKIGTKQVVAVKILLTEAFGGSASKKRHIRFEREAITGAKLRHPYIVPIIDYFQDENLVGIVMPLYARGTLGDLLEARGQISLVKVVHYIQQIAPALDHAHTHNVIHRDIKPDNFLLDEHDHLMLSDFGIARVTGDPNWPTLTTSSDRIMGTAPYMSPEACRGDRVDGHTDIYALGMVIYEMLHGELPFDVHTSFNTVADWHKNDYLPSLHQEHPEIPDMVDQVLLKATAKDPDGRFGSAQELARALSLATMPNSPYNAVTEIDSNSFPTQFKMHNRNMQPHPPRNRSARALASLEHTWNTSFRRVNSTSLYHSAFQEKHKAIGLFLVGILLVLLIIGSVFLFNRSSSTSSFANTTNQITVTQSNIQQAQASVHAYYDDWNKGNFMAAYNLLSPNYQKRYPYLSALHADYERVKYSCLTLRNITMLANDRIQVDIIVDQIQNDPSQPVEEFTLSFIAEKIQGEWRLTPANLSGPIPGICTEPKP